MDLKHTAAITIMKNLGKHINIPSECIDILKTYIHPAVFMQRCECYKIREENDSAQLSLFVFMYNYYCKKYGNDYTKFKLLTIQNIDDSNDDFIKNRIFNRSEEIYNKINENLIWIINPTMFADIENNITIFSEPDFNPDYILNNDNLERYHFYREDFRIDDYYIRKNDLEPELIDALLDAEIIDPVSIGFY